MYESTVTVQTFQDRSPYLTFLRLNLSRRDSNKFDKFEIKVKMYSVYIDYTTLNCNTNY